MSKKAKLGNGPNLSRQKSDRSECLFSSQKFRISKIKPLKLFNILLPQNLIAKICSLGILLSSSLIYAASPIGRYTVSHPEIYGGWYLIIKCWDGDGCLVIPRSEDNPPPISVRLIGIDAPEMPKGNYPGQELAEESKEALEKLILDSWVFMKLYGIDLHQRQIVECFKLSPETNQFVNINLQMILQGLAEVYRGPGIPKLFNKSPYEFVEHEAKTLKKGIWNLENYVSPAIYKKAKKSNPTKMVSH
jgi:endonuclease YncB( thermonuclease family)